MLCSLLMLLTLTWLQKVLTQFAELVWVACTARLYSNPIPGRCRATCTARRKHACALQGGCECTRYAGKRMRMARHRCRVLCWGWNCRVCRMCGAAFIVHVVRTSLWSGRQTYLGAAGCLTRLHLHLAAAHSCPPIVSDVRRHARFSEVRC